MSLPGEAALLAAVLPLGMAAGLDLYLTLLLLAAAIPLGWEAAPPGALAGLATPWIAAAAAALWITEFWVERVPPAALLWNAVHVVARPVAAGLLALLLLEGAGPGWRAGGALGAAAVALAAHAARSGWSLLLWLSRRPRPSRLLVSAAEDAATLALVALLLDRPAVAAALSLLTLAAGVAWTRPSLRAFLFGLRMLRGAGWSALVERRWRSEELLPAWVVGAARADGRSHPGMGLRGSPAALVAAPELGSFRSGWTVVRGGVPAFVFRQGSLARVVELSVAGSGGIRRSVFDNRVELAGAEEGAGVRALLFPKDGPTVDALERDLVRRR